MTPRAGERALVARRVLGWLMIAFLAGVSVLAIRHVGLDLVAQLGRIELLGIAALVLAAAAGFVGSVALISIHWPRLALVVALTAVAAIRLGASIAYQAPQTTDWGEYLHLAEGLVNGAPPFADRAMGWPVLLATIWRLFGESVTAGVLLNVALSGLTGVVLAVWVRGFAGPRASAVAVAVFAVLAGQVAWNLLLATEVPYTLAILAIAVAMQRLVRRSDDPARRSDDPAPMPPAAMWAGLGLLLGLSYWLRSTSIVILPLLLLVPWVTGGGATGTRWRRQAALSTVALIVGFCVVLSPIVAWNRVELGRWSVSNSLFSGWQVFVGNSVRSGGSWNQADRSVADDLLAGRHTGFIPTDFADGSLTPGSLQRLATVDDQLLQMGVQRLTGHGLRWAEFLVRKLDRAWADASSGIGFASSPGQNRPEVEGRVGVAVSLAADLQWVLVLLGALAWYWRRRADPGLEGTIVAAIALPIVLGTLVLEAQPRYHEYVVPLFVAFAAVALARLLRLDASEQADVAAGALLQPSGTPIRS